jgi:hypothetical protein
MRSWVSVLPISVLLLGALEISQGQVEGPPPRSNAAPAVTTMAFAMTQAPWGPQDLAEISSSPSCLAVCNGVCCQSGWQLEGSCEETEDYCEGTQLVECERLRCWNSNVAVYNCNGLVTEKQDCEDCTEVHD